MVIIRFINWYMLSGKCVRVLKDHFFSILLLSVLRGLLTSKDFYTRSYPSPYFLILIIEKEPVFPFSMFSAKQGNYWYHFYNVFGMTRSLSGD